MGKKNINDLLNRLFISEVVGEVGQLGRVLDLGCGEQPYREVYGAHAERVVAVDISRRGSESTDAFVRGSAVAIPFADSSFDFVLCSEVLEHVPDPRRAIGEIARVLRPGGRLVLTVPFLYPIHEEPWDFWRFTLLSNGCTLVEEYPRST
jgi:ubiquinone/menaquinone biosynthesis C-methylase UbiE